MIGRGFDIQKDLVFYTPKKRKMWCLSHPFGNHRNSSLSRSSQLLSAVRRFWSIQIWFVVDWTRCMEYMYSVETIANKSIDVIDKKYDQLSRYSLVICQQKRKWHKRIRLASESASFLFCVAILETINHTNIRFHTTTQNFVSCISQIMKCFIFFLSQSRIAHLF